MPEEPLPSADLDLRLVRCFTVLAEYCHFGRAAAALSLTPSSLSRQITRLEQRVGVRLLDRTPRGTRLTEAGETFLPAATEILHATARAASSARAAAHPSRITIGHMGNLIVTPAVRELRHRHPDADVRTRHLPWREPHLALLERRVDVVVARLPFPTEQLRVTALHDEPRALLIPLDHPLAARESVALDDIAHERLPRSHDPAWNTFWRVDPRPDGSRAPEGPYVDTVEDKLELVAGGQAVAIVPGGVTNGGVHRNDLTTVPIKDIEPAQVVLATRDDDRGRLVTAFRACAESLLTAPRTPPPATA